MHTNKRYEGYKREQYGHSLILQNASTDSGTVESCNSHERGGVVRW